MTTPTPTSRRPIHAKPDRHFVTALARGLDILGAFKADDRVLGNQELARRAGLPKSTISRLTYTLTKLGYLEQGDDGSGASGYRLGSAVLALGSTMLSRMDVRGLARPLMQELADASQAMVSLGMRDRLSMIYVENCRSESALQLRLDVGSRIPIGPTAMGRAYLAACTPAERDELLQGMRERVPQHWPEVQAGVERALEEQDRLGCCTSFGDWQDDVNAIAIAFRPQSGRQLMAINCGGPRYKLSKEYLLEEVRPLMLALQDRLQVLGVARAD
jgi:DNA-binding IclR family transcriptional regulator